LLAGVSHLPILQKDLLRSEKDDEQDEGDDDDEYALYRMHPNSKHLPVLPLCV